MPPRTKRCKNIAAGTGEHMEREKISGWERSKISSQDRRMLRKMVLLKNETMQMPTDESIPHPPEGFRDLEKLVRRFTSLSKKSEVPSSCRVEPFSGVHALPANHQTLSSLPPLPEGGDVSERAIITDDSQETSILENEPAESEKSAGSSDKISESEQVSGSSHTNSPPVASPDKRKRKRNPNEEDSGASKLSEPAAGESAPEGQENFDSFTAAGDVSSDDEEMLELEAPRPANTSTSHTLVLSEEPHVAPESSAPTRSPRALKKKARTGAAGKEEIATGSLLTPLLDDPLMKEMVDIGSHFIRFRDEAESLREALHLVEKRANDLEKKLKASEKARKKAEKDAAGVEGLRDRLRAAENALSDREATLAQRETDIIALFETQFARFSKKIGEHYTRNQDLDEDCILDTLTVLELNCSLARECLKSARTAFERLFPHFFPKTDLPERFDQLAKHFNGKDDPALAHRQASLKIGVEGTIALVAASGEKVDWAKVAAVRGLNSEKWKALIKDAELFSRKLIAILDPRSSASASTAQTEAQESLELEKTATSNAARSGQRENYMLDLMTDASQDMAGDFLDTAAEERRVNLRVDSLLHLARDNNIAFLADEARCRRIVEFQDCAAQTREFLDFCNNTLAMVYNAMFPRNPQPENLTQLMDKFKDVRNIHDFVKAQMVADAKFALIWLRIYHPKMDLDKVVEGVLLKSSKRKINLDRHNAAVPLLPKR
ncbi:hypothetical protein ACQ4PT_029227 [Festuca glaucescens]